MGVMSKLRRLLGILAGHEEELAEAVSKRTGVSKERAQKGLEAVPDAVGTDSERT